MHGESINEHQSGGDDQEEKEEQPKEAFCAYFHSELLAFYEDEEPYTPPKPYVPPIPFPGRIVKQKHNEPPIDVLEEIVPYLESLGDYLLTYQEKNKLKLDDESLLPIHHKKEDSELDDEIAALNEFHSSIEIIAPATSSTIFEDMLLRKERREHHHNQVLVEIQRTIFEVPQKKPLHPTKVWRYLDFLPL
ncbi:hypothetical protein D8674_021427 [Pyrus ussuriensis x Pyrus communis]|uniref:Uncharacterized protein n=1 Tax=Pyrus ussuriensis x Pyrus communis TaxID=2448454 RepID=A0A5N5GH51_9ROSA|nr:hypothetical protein D8674_021427 [Pyrus ussuriensis x Pyrus communis]